MQRKKASLAVSSLLILLLAIVLVGVWLRFRTGSGVANGAQPTAVASVSPSSCGAGWQQMKADTLHQGATSLQGVAAISANNIWVVGSGLIDHWNGANWQSALTPEIPQGNWTAINASSASNIWVIGASGRVPQALHWDGQAWTTTPLPAFSSGVASLSGIAVIAPDNAWAVGSVRSGDYSSGYSYQAFILRWDGSAWREVAGASTQDGKNPQFSGISALSANDIWAVGSIINASKQTRELIEHWNGQNWQLVPGPGQGNILYHIDSATLNGVTAVSPNDVWAVGSWNLSGNGADGSALGMIEHWDGQQWTRAQLYGPESRLNTLNAIKAISPTNVWAVGGFVNPNTRLGNAYMQHWDGKQWSMRIWPTVYGQLTANTSVGLSGVTGTPDGQVIAVGSSVVFTQNPPIDDAAREPAQPFILTSCR